jgi:hypothetical protein
MAHHRLPISNNSNCHCLASASDAISHNSVCVQQTTTLTDGTAENDRGTGLA